MPDDEPKLETPRLKVFDFRTLAERGPLRFDFFRYQHTLYAEDGAARDSAVLGHANVHRGDSVAGLLHASADMGGVMQHRLIVVEQFRFSTILDPETGEPDLEEGMRMSRSGRTLSGAPVDRGRIRELMAGKQKRGEPRKQTLIREAEEETRLTVESAELIASFYPSPGGCSEQVHLYYARLNLGDAPLPDPGRLALAGRADESENIRPIVLTPEEFLNAIEDRQVVDAKWMIAAEWMRRPMIAPRFGLLPGGIAHG